MKKILGTILFIVLAASAGGLYYVYFFILNPTGPKSVTKVVELPPVFAPFGNTNEATTTQQVQTETPAASSTGTVSSESYTTPKLRQLSTTPVAGMAVASSSSSVSIVRFMDRGTGYVYEANSLTENIDKISNTTIPQIYEAYGNKGASSFIIRYLKGETDNIASFYTELRKTGTTTSETPFELKGKFLAPEISQVAVSPTGDKIFTWNIEAGMGVGYISSFDEKTKVKIVSNPLTQVVIDWPEANTVTLSTKASGLSSGYIYSINTKTGYMNKLFGGIRGLTGKMSHDLTKVLFSARTTDGLASSLLNTKDNTTQNTVFKTLSDKCVWSNLRKNEIYCAVPTEIPNGVYPDDWYKGNISFVDQIWYMNSTTGEVHLVGDLLALSNQLIDATNLTLDPKDNFLYFTNKRDLTLWALDLNQ